MPTKVPHGVEVENMPEVVDGVCIDEVVTELVEFNCRPHKSRVDGKRLVAQGRSNRVDRWHPLIDVKCLGTDRSR